MLLVYEHIQAFDYRLHVLSIQQVTGVQETRSGSRRTCLSRVDDPDTVRYHRQPFVGDAKFACDHLTLKLGKRNNVAKRTDHLCSELFIRLPKSSRQEPLPEHVQVEGKYEWDVGVHPSEEVDCLS